ncbi:MAG: hypothetical protein ACRDK9_03570 [Solirubrobacterales bacterium]
MTALLTLGAVVDTGDLGQTVAAAFVAGIGVTLMFSLGILGAARFAEANRDGRQLPAVLFAAIGLLGFLGTLGAVALGLVLLATS